MMTTSYYEYLRNISWKGLIYRRFFVYPIIKKYCKGKVLDVGCGTGQFVKYYQSAKGVDVNTDCVEFCQRQGMDVVRMNYDQLPFVNNIFDTIVLDNVLEHIEDPTPLLMECKRVLTPAGQVIILVPGEKGFERDDDHKQFYDHNKLCDLMSNTSFTVTKRISLPIPRLNKILSAFCFMVVARKFE